MLAGSLPEQTFSSGSRGTCKERGESPPFFFNQREIEMENPIKKSEMFVVPKSREHLHALINSTTNPLTACAWTVNYCSKLVDEMIEEANNGK